MRGLAGAAAIWLFSLGQATAASAENAPPIADQPDAGMIAAAERVAAIIECGVVASARSAFTDRDVTIIENFPPFVFEGAGAVERWSEGMRAHVAGDTALRHAFGPAQDFSRSGGEVFFSLPTTWRGRGVADGKPFVEHGGWAFVLIKQRGRWRVRDYGWAVTALSRE